MWLSYYRTNIYYYIIVFRILRDRGSFGDVTLQWQLKTNESVLASESEFQSVNGFISFADGQVEQDLELSVLADGIPEYDTLYIVELVDVTGEI